MITTGGGWPYPKKCIDSVISGLPENGRILVRDNPSSKTDETYSYLLSKKDELGPHKFVLFSPDWKGEHGINMDFLVQESTAEWALIIDSDIEFTTPNWCKIAFEVIDEYPDMQVCCEMSATNLDPNDSNILPGGEMFPRRWMPRATSWYMLFRPDFVKREGVSLGRNDFDARVVFQDVYPYNLPNFIGQYPRHRWTMENGWQLLWAGLYANGLKEYSCVQIPKKLRKTYMHHGHKICSHMHSLGDIPNSPTSQLLRTKKIKPVI